MSISKSYKLINNNSRRIKSGIKKNEKDAERPEMLNLQVYQGIIKVSRCLACRGGGRFLESLKYQEKSQKDKKERQRNHNQKMIELNYIFFLHMLIMNFPFLKLLNFG